MLEFWRNLVLDAVHETATRIAKVVPNVLAMLTLVVVGLALGLIARLVLTRLARALDLDRRSHLWGLAGALIRSGIRRTPSQLLGTVAFWGVFALFATMGIDTLNLPGSPGATATLAALLPRLLAAALILTVGWLAANFLGQAVLVAAVNAGWTESRLLSRVVRGAVMLFAAATTLTQLGIGTEMVMVTFGITFGGLVFALALAFGLGGRDLARDVLERRLRKDDEAPHPKETISHL